MIYILVSFSCILLGNWGKHSFICFLTHLRPQQQFWSPSHMPSAGAAGVRDRPCSPGAHSLVGRRQNLNKLPQSIEVSALMKVYKSTPGITREEQVKTCICLTRVSKLGSFRPRRTTVSQVRAMCCILGSCGHDSEQVHQHVKRAAASWLCPWAWGPMLPMLTS